jgi:hypothetical protein
LVGNIMAERRAQLLAVVGEELRIVSAARDHPRTAEPPEMYIMRK